MTNQITIGLVQLNSRDVKPDNLKQAGDAVRTLAAKGATLVMLPEHFNFIGPDSSKRENAEPLEDSPSLDVMRNLAQELQLHIHIGSILEKDGDRIYNTGVVFAPSGEIAAFYRKLHLFDVEIPGGLKYLESNIVSPGNMITTFSIGDITFGMATCYDLRFPELFRALTDRGAQVLLLPAAFTLQTGRDHWEVLLRARAVENLCYVAAAGQWGPSPPRNTGFGRSMVVDPWGIVIARAGDGVTTVTADLDLNILKEIRKRFPALEHIRRDIFIRQT